MKFADSLGGWIPVLDEDFMSTSEAVWVAGDGGGVAGALVAELEGTLAGLAIARRMGRLDQQAWEVGRRPVARGPTRDAG